MRLSRRSLAALVVLSLIWGYAWVFMKLALRDAGPFTFAGMRTLLGAASLFVLLGFRGQPLRLVRAREMVALALVNTTGQLGFAQWALMHGQANRTSILMFTMPFWTVLVAWPLLGERVRGTQWLAIGCAATGLLLVVQPWAMRGHGLATASVLAAALCWTFGAIMTKRMMARAPIDLLGMTAWQMFLGSLGLCALALLAGEPPVRWTPGFITALCATAFVSTAFGWVLWAMLLQRLPAGMASMMTLLTPVVAVTSTSLQLGEPLPAADLGGIALIVLGLAILCLPALRAALVAAD